MWIFKAYNFNFDMKQSQISAFLILALLLVFNTNILTAFETETDKQTADESHEFIHKYPYKLKVISYPKGSNIIRVFENQATDESIKILISKNGKPASNIEVWLKTVASPASLTNPKWLSKQQINSNEQGLVEVHFIAKGGAGDYVIQATIEGNYKQASPLQIQINAVQKHWYISLLIGLFGGLALFLFGMDQAGHNLQKVAGDRLRTVLAKLTSNRIMGALLGTIITFVLQSSSASTVMLVGLVSATLLTLTQAIGVIIGAKLGTTLTVQIIAFNVSHYALAIIALGILIRMLGSYKYLRSIGKIIMGFGFIFFGMGIMSEAMSPLASDPDFTSLMLSLTDKPVYALLFATAFTAIIQSSSATIGVAMALAMHGLLSLSACIPISMGASIGTCATALLASLSANRAGKQVAVAHLIYSVSAMLLFFPLIDQLVELTLYLGNILNHKGIIRQVANAFTIYTFAASIVILPFTGLIEKLTLFFVPNTKVSEPFTTKYIQQSSIPFPAIAIEQATREALRMGELLRQQLIGVLLLIEKPNERRCYELANNDNNIDTLERAIRPFLTEVGQNDMDEDLAAKERSVVYICDTLEHMGDVIVNSVLHAIEKMANKNISFSEDGKKEFRDHIGEIIGRYDKLAVAIRNLDFALLMEVIDGLEKLEWQARDMRATHLDRLHKGLAESLESSEAHLTLVGAFLTINRRITDIARTITDEMSEK